MHRVEVQSACQTAELAGEQWSGIRNALWRKELRSRARKWRPPAMEPPGHIVSTDITIGEGVWGEMALIRCRNLVENSRLEERGRGVAPFRHLLCKINTRPTPQRGLPARRRRAAGAVKGLLLRRRGHHLPDAPGRPLNRPRGEKNAPLPLDRRRKRGIILVLRGGRSLPVGNYAL